MSKSYAALLAPDIVEGIVAGNRGQALVLEDLRESLPDAWMEQWAFAYGLDRAEMRRTLLRGLNNLTMRYRSRSPLGIFRLLMRPPLALRRRWR
jgi:hypothetical protein